MPYKANNLIGVPTVLDIRQEEVMAALTAVLVSALLSCGVNGQFSVTISCPSSGKKTLMSVSVYILYRY